MNNTTNNVTESGNTEQQFGFKVISGKEIQDFKSDRKNYLIDGVVTPGLNLLAAPRKKGKSWMALDMALCVAGEDDFLGRKTEHGKVLYFALEDNEERIKQRLNVLLDDADAPEGIQFSFSTSRIGSSFFNDLNAYLYANTDIKLVIIDVLQKVRRDKNLNQSEYSHDYVEVGTLKKIADSHGISILVVHHTRKTKDNSDPLNEIYGGVGVTSVADTIIMIRSGGDASQKQVKLCITGRDLQDQKLEVKFDNVRCRWVYIGTEEELNVKKEEDAYAESLPIKAVKKLLENNKSWTGTITELMDYARSTIDGMETMSASAFARKINKFDALLLRDGIVHVKPDPNGGINGRKHIFIREDTVQAPPAASGQDTRSKDVSCIDSGYISQDMADASYDTCDGWDAPDDAYTCDGWNTAPDDRYNDIHGDCDWPDNPFDSGYISQGMADASYDTCDGWDAPDVYDKLDELDEPY